jgi:hypothetical protein
VEGSAVSVQIDGIAVPVAEAAVRRAQLHGEACITCGTARGFLIPAGYHYTTGSEGGRLGWAVVACSEHRRAA